MTGHAHCRGRLVNVHRCQVGSVVVFHIAVRQQKLHLVGVEVFGHCIVHHILAVRSLAGGCHDGLCGVRLRAHLDAVYIDAAGGGECHVTVGGHLSLARLSARRGLEARGAGEVGGCDATCC